MESKEITVEQGLTETEKAYIAGWEDAVLEQDAIYDKLVWKRRQAILNGLTEAEQRAIMASNEAYAGVTVPPVGQSLLADGEGAHDEKPGGSTVRRGGWKSVLGRWLGSLLW